MTQRNTPGPLARLRVLDFTEHMAGPFCTMILADMGAEVIKVERPGKGDSSRGMGDGSERNAYFRNINRNKKSLTLAPSLPARHRLPRGSARALPSHRTSPRSAAGFNRGIAMIVERVGN
jgi:hypothetical protein